MSSRDNFAGLQFVRSPSPSLSPRVNSLYLDDEIVPDYFKVLKWSLIPILCFTAAWLFEIYVLQNPHRLVPNPAEFTMRIFGFSHFVVGFVFMMSSKRMRRASGWVWFVGLLAISTLISFCFYSFGGRGNPVMVIFYFLFFMVHGFRDQVYFYKPFSGDPSIERTRSRILGLIQVCLIVFLMYVLVPAYLLYLRLKPKTYSPELKTQIDSMMPYLRGVLLLSWLALPLSVIGLRRVLPRFPGGLTGFCRDNKRILFVLLCGTGMVVLSPALGPWVFNFLILSHFVGWYFYASRQLSLGSKPPNRSDSLWKWLRGSVAGFQRLHLGVAAVIFLIILINHFVRTDTGPVNALLGANAFYYWTVIHVTISFAPKS